MNTDERIAEILDAVHKAENKAENKAEHETPLKSEPTKTNDAKSTSFAHWEDE